MIPAGNYHLLVNAVHREEQHAWLDATTLPAGERIRVRLFRTQPAQIAVALMHQRGLPKNFKGGQFKCDIKLHPEYGNSIGHLYPLPPEQCLPVETDTDVDRVKPIASFA